VTSSSSSTAPAGNVVTLSRSRVACAHCDGLAEWRVIGDRVENRSCTADLGYVADDTPTDGMAPLVLVRIFPKRGAA
jgi:hypothetical protein